VHHTRAVVTIFVAKCFICIIRCSVHLSKRYPRTLSTF
jgi:hypothetical protein